VKAGFGVAVECVATAIAEGMLAALPLKAQSGFKERARAYVVASFAEEAMGKALVLLYREALAECSARRHPVR
jgi:hypothetical protein